MAKPKAWWRAPKSGVPAELWTVYEEFTAFVIVVWAHLGLPKPTPVQLDFARTLQYGNRRLILEAFRGMGKSFITVAFVCWLLMRDPQHKIEVISASKSLADDFSTFALQLINEMAILRHLRPRDDQRSSKQSFDVGPAKADKSPSVKSVGITGQITGTRADTIIADDIEVPNNSETTAQREKIAERVKEFDAILKPGGRVIFLGTPQTEQSLYNVLRERGYEVIVWPAEYPDEKYRARMEDVLAPFILDGLKEGKRAGDPVEPTRFTSEDLAERKASYGLSGYALQFMLDTRLSDAERYPLKTRDILFMPLDNKSAPRRLVWGPKAEQRLNVANYGLSGDGMFSPAFKSEEYDDYKGSVMFVDPSGKGKDETAIAVAKQSNGMIFVTKCEGRQGGYDDDVLRWIATTAKEQNVNLILVEANFGQGMFSKLLQPHLVDIDYPCKIEEQVARHMKEARIIDTLEPILNQHRLVMCETIIETDDKTVQGYPTDRRTNYRLFHQLTRMTREKGCLAQDDRLDALAGVVGHWVEAMGQSTQRAAEKAKNKAMDEVIRKHLENQLHAKWRKKKTRRSGWVR